MEIPKKQPQIPKKPAPPAPTWFSTNHLILLFVDASLSTLKLLWMDSAAVEGLATGQAHARTHFLTPFMPPAYFCDNLFRREDERM